MNKKTLILAAIALAMAACTQNETTNAPAGNPITIAASINQEPDTRIAFDDAADHTKITWTPGDAFAICAEGIATADNHTFTLEGDGGATTGNFTNTSLNNIEVPATTINAIYKKGTTLAANETSCIIDFATQDGTATNHHLMHATFDNTAAQIANWQDIGLKFESKTAILQITLKNPAFEGQTVTDITLSALGLMGSCMYTFADGQWMVSFADHGIAIGPQTVPKGEKSFTILVAQPPVGITTGPITLKARCNNQNYTATLGSGAFNEPNMYKIEANMHPEGQTMQFTIETQNDGDWFTLPFANPTRNYTLTVDWGDGKTTTINRHTSNESTDIAHKYTEAGKYTVTLTSDAQAGSDQMPKWNFLAQNASAALLKSMDTPMLTMDATDLSLCFKGCTALETIHPALFARNTSATIFTECFAGCTSLMEIPNGLFHGVNVDMNFEKCFYDCQNARINPNIFCNEATEMDKRFEGRQINFTSCFENVGSTIADGQYGTAPSLWLYQYGSVSKEKCFYNCANMTNISAAAAAGWTY